MPETRACKVISRAGTILPRPLTVTFVETGETVSAVTRVSIFRGGFFLAFGRVFIRYPATLAPTAMMTRMTAKAASLCFQVLFGIGISVGNLSLFVLFAVIWKPF